MKHLFTLIMAAVCLSAFGQTDFNSQIQKVADTISKKIVQSGNRKVAVTDFINLDETISQLGQFLSDELSSELSNLSENLTKFEIVERTNVDIIFKEKNLIQSVDGSKMARDLGKLKAADILIWAIISDFEGYYRVNIKLLDTKTGNAIGSFKTQFIKTPTFEGFNKKIILKSESSNAPSATTAEIKKEERKNPCEENIFGSLNITNKTATDVSGQTKIVIRIPKVSNPDPRFEENYYFIILERDEMKSLVKLREGVYDYETKRYSHSGSKGWNDMYASISSGQIQIEKCKPTELIIR